MKPGSVVVDLAGEAGGDCELSVPGEAVTRHGVRILAPLDLPSTMAEHASQLYARNVTALLALLVLEEGDLRLPWDDPIVTGACVARAGQPGPPQRVEQA
jgi:NAD(P) transhydrogenase subunit alpha